MQRALAAQYTPCISPNNFHAPDVVKFSSLRRPSCAPGLKSSKWGLEAQWRRQLVSISFNRKPEIVCLFDGLGKLFGEDAKDAARKAFEKAREGKDKAFRMWKELSEKTAFRMWKELSEKTAQDMTQDDEDGGDDGSFGGRYGGWGGSGDREDEDDSNETLLTSFILLLVYMKMRGPRWSRDGYPFTDYTALRLWYTYFADWMEDYYYPLHIKRFLTFIKLNYLLAKYRLHSLRKRPRTASSSTSIN